MLFHWKFHCLHLKSQPTLLTAVADGSNQQPPLVDRFPGQHSTCCSLSCSAGDSQQEWQEPQDGADPYQEQPRQTEAIHLSNSSELPDAKAGPVEPISMAEASTAMALKVRIHAPLHRPCCLPVLCCAAKCTARCSNGSS